VENLLLQEDLTLYSISLDSWAFNLQKAIALTNDRSIKIGTVCSLYVHYSVGFIVICFTRIKTEEEERKEY
jgi:hypothetical protein